MHHSHFVQYSGMEILTHPVLCQQLPKLMMSQINFFFIGTPEKTIVFFVFFRCSFHNLILHHELSQTLLMENDECQAKLSKL